MWVGVYVCVDLRLELMDELFKVEGVGINSVCHCCPGDMRTNSVLGNNTCKLDFFFFF